MSAFANCGPPFARLDEVLSGKAALDAELRDYVRARVAEPGVAVAELGARKSKSW